VANPNTILTLTLNLTQGLILDNVMGLCMPSTKVWPSRHHVITFITRF